MDNNITFNKLNSKGKKALLSLLDRVKYIRFSKFYCYGGFSYEEFYNPSKNDLPNIDNILSPYEEYIELLSEEFRTSFIKEVNVSLVDYLDGKVVYPVDIEEVNRIVYSLRKV